jgi:uncharacterized membrane protein
MAHLQGGIKTASSSENRQYKPNHEDMALTEERTGESSENVGDTERLLSAIMGGGLLLRSMRRGAGFTGRVTALIGIALLRRAATGYCPAYRAMGLNTRYTSNIVSL